MLQSSPRLTAAPAPVAGAADLFAVGAWEMVFILCAATAMQALIFDLFNTLVRCDPHLLPRVVIADREMPSTLGLVADTLEEYGHTVDIDTLAQTTLRVSKTQEAEKVRTGREFPSAHRWTSVLAELEIYAETGVVDTLVQRHMDALCGSAVIANEDRLALQRLHERLPLALLSNFDHGPSARGLLDRLQLTPLFEVVAVSDDLGWRKPETRVFAHVLDALGVPASESVYVGDSIEFDVIGAHSSGMRAAWIAKEDAALPTDIAAPAYRARSIAELEPQLMAR